jgi:hypothetical protein
MRLTVTSEIVPVNGKGMVHICDTEEPGFLPTATSLPIPNTSGAV